MAETEQFEENVGKAKAIKNPLMLTLRDYPKSVAQLIGLTLLSTLCYYTFFSALIPFAVKRNGLNDGMVFWALSIATAVFVVLQYPFGWTADRFGRKPQLFVWSGAIALLMVPISTLIRPEAPLVIHWLGDIGHSSWFFWYVSIGAVVAFITTLTLPETKGLVLK